MKALGTIAKRTLLGATAIVVGLPLYALPATLTLPPGSRPGIEPLTLSEAANRILTVGKSGEELVDAAQALVAGRMQYSRRNSFDSPARAFERGYGYCTQQAYALADLLARLGFEAQVVHAFRNRFPDGTGGGHAWVRVRLEGEERDVDSIFYEPDGGELTFSPQSPVRKHTPLLRLVTNWGEAAVNAHRYYCTGKDE